ncbi:SusC/RagA family TonB-linked outer membrane protein [Sphingobacterium litopenaei]|uniref:SusC/RagA family TonB-linked outer membrane protein n=1 Tax=Sphingobacterium litopenaei TaxID=2763500 RepID=A0ABR7YHI3_9SPHI|nr:SusC/RagA family TonB-linked outer membrane protein [Sphingobacterium litopenaei]MBD1430663.1 SusC/RagA family TonB-linked outer membrane protein [Sphingobacterium litopenaei]
MKVLIFILLASLQFVSAKITAQTITLNLQNAKLEDVFRSISSQSQIKFLYNDEILVKVPNITLQVKNEPLENVLSKILSKQKFEYKILSNTVLVSSKAPTPMPENNTIQTRVIGVVVDGEGKALSNVSIVLVGSTVATMTDKDGKFSIQANVGNVLEARYIGYKTSRVTISNLTNTRIVLSADESNIEEVQVVATGYQNLDRKLFTGASTRVNAKDAERNGVPDISRMLEGQVAGVSVQNVSGTFGAAPKIRVRGATSLSGENKPLWVVDGIILEDLVNISNEALSTGDANTLIGSSVAGLNPDDIESFTILKDAAATAMYGARAMNGVIVVTTKKGRNTEGKTHVNYSSNYTTYLKPNYNQFDIMNSAEQMSVLIEQDNKGYFNHSSVSRGSTGGIFFKMYNKMYELNDDNTFSLENTTEAKLNFLKRYAQANTDWFDVLFKNSLLQDHSLSLTSGSSKSQTYLSTSFIHDNGQTLGDNVKRYTANLRNSFQLSDKLSAEILVNGSIRDQRAPGTLTRQSDPVYGQYSRDFDINPYSYSLNTSRLITPYDENGDLEYFTRSYAPFNIINELNTNYLKLLNMDLKVQGGIKYKILDKIIASVDAAYRYANTERQHYILEGSNMVKAYKAAGDATIADGNILLYNDPDIPNGLPQIVLPEGGFYNTTLNNLKNYYFRGNLEYDDTFKENHRLNLFGSFELRQTDRQNSDYEGIGYQYDNGGLVNPNYRFFKKMIEGGDPYFGMGYDWDRFAAVAFRGAYAFKDRYSINFTTRIDGSNRLGNSSVARWLPTWNISGKWNIDQEEFFNSENNILSAVSIRGTYGLVANLGSARNATPLYYNRITYRPYEDEKETITSLNSLGNSELTWEKAYELNIGADIQLFNKIDITADYYKRNIFDLIGSIRTSGIGGQFIKQANYADMEANGFEFTVAGNPIRKDDGFSWRTQFNFGINKNKVTNLEVNQNIWTLVRAEGAAVEGYAQRGLFSIQFDGLDPNYGYPTYIGTEGEKDTYIYLQSEDIDYLKYHGPVDPTFTGGFYNNFKYKNFGLTALLTFSSGNYIRLQPTYLANYSDLQSMSKDMVNRWLMPGDELVTNIPSLLDPTSGNRVLRANGTTVSSVYPYNAYNYSDQRVAKGDFIRFKQIQLSYSLPKSITNKLKMSSAQIALVGNNIALLYSDKKLNGADPEFFNNGGVAMPIPRQYTFSLKVGF